MHLKTINRFFNIDKEITSTDMVNELRNTKFYYILHHYNRP